MEKELEQLLKDNQPNYIFPCFLIYTEEELEWWVKLFTKRAEHRSDSEKKAKDLKDAKNYQLMLDEKRNLIKIGQTN